MSDETSPLVISPGLNSTCSLFPAWHTSLSPCFLGYPLSCALQMEGNKNTFWKKKQTWCLQVKVLGIWALIPGTIISIKYKVIQTKLVVLPRDSMSNYCFMVALKIFSKLSNDTLNKNLIFKPACRLETKHNFPSISIHYKHSLSEICSHFASWIRR